LGRAIGNAQSSRRADFSNFWRFGLRPGRAALFDNLPLCGRNGRGIIRSSLRLLGGRVARGLAGDDLPVDQKALNKVFFVDFF
jgi:hypothetical protein